MSDSHHVRSTWLLICRSVQSHADFTAANCRKEAGALIRREASRFCDREPPESDTELSERQKEALFLTSRVSSISHADLMAKSHPGVADQILVETKAFLEEVGLDASPYKASMRLISKISELCHSDAMQAL